MGVSRKNEIVGASGNRRKQRQKYGYVGHNSVSYGMAGKNRSGKGGAKEGADF